MSIPATIPLPDLPEELGSFLAAEMQPHSGRWQVGPITITGTYPTEVMTLAESALPGYLLKVFNTLKPPPGGPDREPPMTALPPAVAALPAAAQRWLLYALLLLACNKNAARDFDYVQAGRFLAENIAQDAPAALTADEFDFEYQVLGRTGWLEAALQRQIAPLPGPDRAQAGRNYARHDDDEETGELKPGVLKDLDAPLLAALTPELLKWRSPDQKPRAKQRIEQLRWFAEWVQIGAWRLFQPYLAARTDGPYMTGFRYADSLYDKTARQPTERQRLGYVVNRMNLVGSQRSKAGQGEKGQGEGQPILARACYDESRDEDRLALRKAAADWLARYPKWVKGIDFLVLHTDSVSHGHGDIGLVTDFPFHMPQAEWRWKQLFTLIHELGHVLIHPGLMTAANAVPASQVIIEGFVEVIARDLYDKIIETRTGEIVSFIQAGVGEPVDPKPAVVGYGGSGEAAVKIYNLVGRDRFYRAFFNGEIAHVGLPLG